MNISTMKEANNRIVYVSGPHGVGKSTVFEGLSRDDKIIVSEQVAHFALDEIIDRQLWRILLHLIEHRINLRTAVENPEKIVIGDRCVLDDLAYQEAFCQLGWLSAEERTKLGTVIDDLHLLFDVPLPMNIVIIMPPFAWNRERIESRWQRGKEVKWRETDWTYLHIVREIFEGMQLLPQCRSFILRETDKNLRLDQIRKWINSFKK